MLEELQLRPFLSAVSEYENQNYEDDDEQQTRQQRQDDEQRVGGGAREDLNVDRVRRCCGVVFVRDGRLRVDGIAVTRPSAAPRSSSVTPTSGVVRPSTVCLRLVLSPVVLLM